MLGHLRQSSDQNCHEGGSERTTEMSQTDR